MNLKSSFRIDPVFLDLEKRLRLQLYPQNPSRSDLLAQAVEFACANPPRSWESVRRSFPKPAPSIEADRPSSTSSIQISLDLSSSIKGRFEQEIIPQIMKDIKVTKLRSLLLWSLVMNNWLGTEKQEEVIDPESCIAMIRDIASLMQEPAENREKLEKIREVLYDRLI